MSRFMLLLSALLTFFATPALANTTARIGDLPILPVAGTVTNISTVELAGNGQLCEEGRTQFLPKLEVMPDITAAFPTAVIQTTSWCLVVPLPEKGLAEFSSKWVVTLKTNGSVVEGYRNQFEMNIWGGKDLRDGDSITVLWQDINPRWEAMISLSTPKD